MAGETAFFVQFPHPGGEHNPRTEDMPWNTGDHRRKFLVTYGRYLDGDRMREGELVFWGEWEPPSRVERCWRASGQLPQALHRPYWVQRNTSCFRQNTDPWVFGDRMIYSNCKQLTPRLRPNSMQHLIRGSVICFGSTVDRKFCVDTVFVVASAEPWVPAEAAHLDAHDAFKTCTAGSIVTKKGDAHLPLTLFRGATVDDRVEGMFSFVPARPADGDGPRFARPQIDLPELINPSNQQSTWGSRRPLTMHRVRQAWEEVRRQVVDAGCVLAVQLETPRLETDKVVVPESSRQHR